MCRSGSGCRIIALDPDPAKNEKMKHRYLCILYSGTCIGSNSITTYLAKVRLNNLMNSCFNQFCLFPRFGSGILVPDPDPKKKKKKQKNKNYISNFRPVNSGLCVYCRTVVVLKYRKC